MKVFFFPLVLEWEDEMITKRGNENCEHGFFFFFNYMALISFV